MDFSIENSVGGLSTYLRRYPDKVLKGASSRAIKRTIRGVVTEAKKEIRDRRYLNTRKLPAKKIEDRYMRTKVSASSTMPISSMLGRVTFQGGKGYGISLSYFNTKRVPAGSNPRNKARLYTVSAEILGRRIVYRGAFMANAKGSKASTVFRRTSSGRLPLKKLFGIDLARIVRDSGLDEELARSASARLSKEFLSNVEFLAAREAAKS